MKSVLRQQVRMTLTGMPPEERAQKSAGVCDHILALPEWQAAEQVLAYMAMDDEVDLTQLIDHAVAAGKSIYLPRIVRAEVEFFAWDGAPDSLDPHPFGMLEPTVPRPGDETAAPEHRPLELTRPTLCLCPGRSFDRDGTRLGRGKGYYDRFLSKLRAVEQTTRSPVVVAGVCFDAQLVDRVPAGPGDQHVELVITETSVFRGAHAS